MKFTLRQLEVFLATAHHQNITLAADQLAMSQSAASESLKSLERQFDIQLFDRAGKRLQLNEQGRLLRTQAEAFMERARGIEQMLLKHSEVGSVKVGATLSIGNYLAINILSQFRQLHPDALVSLKVANTTRITQQVLNYDLDIGLIEGEVAAPDLHVTPWRMDELCVFCAPEHPFARRAKPVLNDADLLAAKWILRESGSGTRQAFDYAMHGILPDIKVELELQHTEAIKRAVEQNMGVGCLSSITLVDAFKRGSLVRLQVPQRDFKRRFYFILHKSKYMSPGIEKWLELCQSYSGDKQ